MTSEQYIAVGKLGKPHGLSGAFRFLLQRELKNKRKAPPYFALEVKGSWLPFFIASIEWTGFNEGLILLEEINNPEKARRYSGTELFLSAKDAEAYLRKDAGTLDYLVGFKAIDEQQGEIGLITEMIDNPGQVLLSIEGKTGEVMIPFVEDFVVSLNKKKKEIRFNLPEGLLDL